MTGSGLTFEALGAGYGDTLLVSCAHGRGTWLLLVDTGPDECWPTLKARLERLPADAKGRRHIDLVVISHIDHDHIGAAKALFDDRTLGLSFGDIWFNAPPRLATRGVAEGQTLAELLGAQPAALPWNRAWAGAPAVTLADRLFVELPSSAGQPRLTLLSPSATKLDALFKVWDKELRALAKPAKRRAAPAVSRGLLDLQALAAKKTPLDRAPANGSSIALLLEHEGVSVLLTADAHATVLVPALRALATHRGTALPWKVDVFKLSHHGSRANVTLDLLSTVQAQHYVVSTNGAIFGHPDDEAIARTVLHGGTPQTIWFNYANEHSARWAATSLQAWGSSAKEPVAGTTGVTLEIARRATESQTLTSASISR
ncbi:MAG: MBL fold metallo-hydrolase [Variovorax sp.]